MDGWIERRDGQMNMYNTCVASKVYNLFIYLFIHTSYLCGLGSEFPFFCSLVYRTIQSYLWIVWIGLDWIEQNYRVWGSIAVDNRESYYVWRTGSTTVVVWRHGTAQRWRRIPSSISYLSGVVVGCGCGSAGRTEYVLNIRVRRWDML